MLQKGRHFLLSHVVLFLLFDAISGKDLRLFAKPTTRKLPAAVPQRKPEMWRGNIRLYTLRELVEKNEEDFLNDYYDTNQVPLKKELIWSEESENHPEYGKDVPNLPNR